MKIFTKEHQATGCRGAALRAAVGRLLERQSGTDEGLWTMVAGHGKTVGKRWEIYGKLMGNMVMGNLWENYGNTEGNM